MQGTLMWCYARAVGSAVLLAMLCTRFGRGLTYGPLWPDHLLASPYLLPLVSEFI